MCYRLHNERWNKVFNPGNEGLMHVARLKVGQCHDSCSEQKLKLFSISPSSTLYVCSFCHESEMDRWIDRHTDRHINHIKTLTPRGVIRQNDLPSSTLCVSQYMYNIFSFSKPLINHTHTMEEKN